MISSEILDFYKTIIFFDFQDNSAAGGLLPTCSYSYDDLYFPNNLSTFDPLWPQFWCYLLFFLQFPTRMSPIRVAPSNAGK
mmetsp:Transcript_30458/g.69740  ORF Transcript_30458/g.69740 Transcript_30458/m.69740 type:complete len:81 (-) Transcript_30458:23-265(-)